MATTEVNQLTEDTSPSEDDVVLTNDAESSNSARKVALKNLMAGRLPVYTDGTRPAAGTAGRMIFNTSDGQMNIDDGTNWTLPDGTTT